MSLNKNYPLLHLILFFVIMLNSFAYVVNNNSKNSSRNTILIWYESEKLNIQQGNFLSSITKLERLINSPNSDLVGVKFVKFRGDLWTPLIDLGQNFKIEKFENSDFINVHTNVYTLDYLVQVALAENLLLFVNFKPKLNHFFLIFSTTYFLLLFFFFNKLNFSYFQSKILNRRKLKLQRVRRKTFANKLRFFLSKKLAHDIRSPLSTLNLISSKIVDLDMRQLQLSVINQVNQIADDLLKNTKEISSSPQVQTQQVTYFDLFNELKKEYEFKSATLKSKFEFSINLNVKEISVHAPKFLYSSLNNLIQNSIEASSHLDSALIKIEAGLVADSHIKIQVIDFGKGITEDLRLALGKSPISSGKAHLGSGNGIGVYNTYQDVQNVNGTIEIESILNEKTIISIILPITTF